MGTDRSWQPSTKDNLDAVLDQNPWNRLGHVPSTLAKPVRHLLANNLWKTLLKAPYRYQVIMGPRRVGKTVGLYQTIQQLLTSGVEPRRLWFLRLDHPLLMRYDLGQWTRAIIKKYNATNDSPFFFFLDEVNYSSQWDKWLKTFYDEQWPVRVVATSSSTAALRNRSIESGIGRWNEQYLTPYAFVEFLSLRRYNADWPDAESDLYETMCRTIRTKADSSSHALKLKMFLLIGGFPELLEALRENDLEGELFRSQQVLRSEAVQRVTGMDIPQAFDIKNPLVLEKLLYILAGQMGGLMNISNLATDLELSRATVHQYINYLEQAYLVFTLPNYSPSEESVQRKGRKVYFVDGAVRNAALQRGLRPMTDSVEWGHLIENSAASHLYALSLQSGARLYHWRDRDHEVDLIYSDSGKPTAFEIAARPGHHRKGLRAMIARYPDLHGRCFIVSDDSDDLDLPADDPEGIGRIPLVDFLIAVGVQTKAAISRRLGLD